MTYETEVTTRQASHWQVPLQAEIHSTLHIEPSFPPEGPEYRYNYLRTENITTVTQQSYLISVHDI
jgi:hypothetical protein